MSLKRSNMIISVHGTLSNSSLGNSCLFYQWNLIWHVLHRVGTRLSGRYIQLLRNKSCICQVSYETLLTGSQKCKQTNVLHRRYKYGAIICYSLNLSFLEKSKFEFITLLLWKYPFTSTEFMHIQETTAHKTQFKMYLQFWS